jgi:hypothetical protein
MIPRHKIFHTVLFLLIFLKFIGSSFTESVKYENIKKSFTVNKSSGYSDKDSTMKSLCFSGEHFVDLILKRTSVGNYLHLSPSNLIPKSLIQISSRFLL